MVVSRLFWAGVWGHSISHSDGKCVKSCYNSLYFPIASRRYISEIDSIWIHLRGLQKLGIDQWIFPCWVLRCSSYRCSMVFVRGLRLRLGYPTRKSPVQNTQKVSFLLLHPLINQGEAYVFSIGNINHLTTFRPHPRRRSPRVLPLREPMVEET